MENQIQIKSIIESIEKINGVIDDCATMLRLLKSIRQSKKLNSIITSEYDFEEIIIKEINRLAYANSLIIVTLKIQTQGDNENARMYKESAISELENARNRLYDLYRKTSENARKIDYTIELLEKTKSKSTLLMPLTSASKFYYLLYHIVCEIEDILVKLSD